ESIEALVAALEQYEGTVVFVSHDRWFVSRVASRVFEIHAHGVTDFKGNYSEYLAHSGHDHLDQQSVVLRAKQEKKSSIATDNQQSWADRKRAQNRKKALPKRRDELLEQIDG